jgi:hypothetical protein
MQESNIKQHSKILFNKYKAYTGLKTQLVKTTTARTSLAVVLQNYSLFCICALIKSPKVVAGATCSVCLVL